MNQYDYRKEIKTLQHYLCLLFNINCVYPLQILANINVSIESFYIIKRDYTKMYFVNKPFPKRYSIIFYIEENIHESARIYDIALNLITKIIK